MDKELVYGPEKVIVSNLFSGYLKWGGFPEVALSESEFEKNKILKEYLTSIFFRDLVERYKIENNTLLEILLDRLLSSFSQKFSLTSFYKQYKGKFPFSKDTLFKYYHYFLMSMLIFEVRKFSESSYKRMRNPAKIYLVDTGIARRVTSEDRGKLLENIVFLELRKRSEEIFYFEEEKECDFVVRNNNKFYAYQVCFELTEDNREREIKGLVTSCYWLGLKKGIILTYAQEEEIDWGGIKIKIIPAWKWLLEKKRAGEYRL
ncbi:ATP-binding protein [Candidatus Calescamantes bacterium]|nr:ATP-binding protein [Candidatus Calescamantes bacterium]